MRIALAIVIGLVTSASAGGPPSKTLERAIKLYDKKDFYSAHIEFTKVTEKESGDDADNIKRAEFFVGKTLYQIQAYAASLAMFEKIRLEGAANTYHTAALKWFAALARVVPKDLEAFAGYPANAFDDPSLESVRDELFYLRALGKLNRGDLANAALAAGKVSKQSAFSSRARLLEALVGARMTKPNAAAAFDAVPAGDDIGDLSALAQAQAHVHAKA